MNMMFEHAYHETSPLEMIIDLAESKGFACQRNDDESVDITVTGKHADLTLSMAWQEDYAALLVACYVPVEVTDATREATVKALDTINQNVWLGHFDLSGDGDMLCPTFRYTLLMNMVPAHVSMHLIADVVDVAIAECERFYPTFQQAQEGDIRLYDGLSAIVFETVGEA